MSDHKWDRFKRSFGVNPSNDLITGRDNKIKAAIVTVDQQIARLVTAGLPPAGLQRERADIERSRVDALGRRSPKDQYAALDPVKDLARKLATDAPGLVDTQINTLIGDLARVRGEVQSAVDAAESITQPLCQAAVATELRAVKGAAAIAEGRPNDVAKRDALDDIDLGPLKAAQATAKPADTQVRYLGTRTKWATDNLARLPDGQAKDDFVRDIKVQTDELAALAGERDIANLLLRAKTAADAMTRLNVRIGGAIGDWEGLQTARAEVALVVDQAKAIRCDVGKAAVKAELDLVEHDVAEAEKLPTYGAIGDALRAKPLKVLLSDLAWAVAAARNIDAGVPKLLDGLDAVIKKLPRGKEKDGFANELASLQISATALETETVMKTVQDGYAKLRREGDELMGRVLKKSGDEGYRDAIAARFGVNIVVKPGATVNLEGAYSALEAVPEGHVGHDKLKEIVFSGKPEGGGDYGKSVISVGEYEKDYTDTYEVGGKKVEANGFNVTMLHEIGHAVDDKHKIMAGIMDTAGGGQWKSETVVNVRKALSDATLAELGNVPVNLTNYTKNMINEAMDNKDLAKPGDVTVSRSQLKILQKYAAIAKAANEANKPWFNNSPASLAIGDRVYVDSGGQGWFSYSLSERTRASVRNYMWRSPAEWFADLYGIAWLTKKQPIAGVPADVTTWLPP